MSDILTGKDEAKPYALGAPAQGKYFWIQFLPQLQRMMLSALNPLTVLVSEQGHFRICLCKYHSCVHVLFLQYFINSQCFQSVSTLPPLQTDRKENSFGIGKIFYDEDVPRVRIIEEEQLLTQKDYYDVLYLHNMRKEYRLNLKTRQCDVTALTRPFRPFGVPPMANFTGEATIGSPGIPGEYIIIENFNGQFSDGDKFFGYVTNPDCIPVANGLFSEKYGFIMNSFFDITIGVSDVNAFIPPRECTGK
ncbi:mammalian ependymin-related protein 1-like [Ostrea edulis]|uniref:mammalian ependymin-related protein 1-like n=1 Tax=Ostrea edulis TaxID=37623 RepID=UPI0024AFC9D5|nr:mammalian ependymin-related protein 1-like [Ostrea edulis]